VNIPEIILSGRIVVHERDTGSPAILPLRILPVVWVSRWLIL